MNITYPRVISLLAVLLLLVSMAHAAEQGPGLRQTNYLGLLTHTGEQVKLELRSHQRSPSYADELNYVIVARDSREIAAGMVPLGTTKMIAFRAPSEGLCVLEIEPGYNAAYVDPGATPQAYIASDTIPLRMVGPLSPAYFYVPDGCKRFTLHVTAEVAREAARIRILSPTGQVVYDEEGEFDSSTAIKADVPPGQDSKVWSLSVEKPRTAGWHLDKVVLSLDPPLVPYLTRRADWALAFGTREHARPSRPDRLTSKRRGVDEDGGPSERACSPPHRATNAPLPLTPQDGRTALPFSYILENKFVQCLQRRVRPIMLTLPGYDVPRKVRLILEMNPDSAALGCAETAAFGGGGGFLIGNNPQLRSVQRRFREFADDHPALFAGLDSFAQVGVAFFPQQTYFGNKRHFVEVRRVTQQLLDGHILFDYLIEDQFTVEILKKYTALILPRVTHLSPARAAALKNYVASGGVALVIGSAAEFDDLGRQRRVPALGDILETAGGAEPAVRQIGAGRTAYAAALPQAGRTLAGWITELAGRSLAVIRADHSAELGKVRINAFRQPGQDHYIVHVLNYNVPLGVDPPELKPAGPIEVSLPVSDAARMKLRCYDPWGETADLPVAADGDRIRFTLPQLRVYKIVEIYRQ